MTFDKLTQTQQAQYVKKEFLDLIKYFFDYPGSLLDFVKNKKITVSDGLVVLKELNTLNKHACICCRAFDNSKLSLSPINDKFIPILDIAQDTAKKKTY